MTESSTFFIREASIADRQNLAKIIHFEVYVHRHLDWRGPLDWLDDAPFFIAKSDNYTLAAIACPADPPDVAWIRLLAISSDLPITNTWEKLWGSVKEYYRGQASLTVAAIPRQGWFGKLLAESDFNLINQVVMLLWDCREIPAGHDLPELIIRPMNHADLPSIEELDKSAFSPLWRISETSLNFAYRQAAYTTVAEIDNTIAGYQISTSSQHGGHLARLAVHPGYQRNGIGQNLLWDLLRHFNERGARNVSVNTQIDNQPSLALYYKIGFQQTDETFPVYEYEITGNLLTAL